MTGIQQIKENLKLAEEELRGFHLPGEYFIVVEDYNPPLAFGFIQPDNERLKQNRKRLCVAEFIPAAIFADEMDWQPVADAQLPKLLATLPHYERLKVRMFEEVEAWLKKVTEACDKMERMLYPERFK